MKIIADGRTRYNLRKLITSAPMEGTTKLSLIDLRALKLNNRHRASNAIGRNSLSSLFSMGQRILRILPDNALGQRDISVKFI